MKYISLMILFVASNVCLAQQKISYSGTFDFAILNGSFETNALIQTAQGIKKGGWFAGAGFGIDHYRVRTVPVFIELKKEFTAKRVQPFVQAAAGMNVAWATQEQKQQVFDPWISWRPFNDNGYSFKNGFYSRAGVGVILNPKSKVQFSTSAGWTYKTYSEEYDEQVYTGSTVKTHTHTNIYRLSRLYFGFGVSF